MSKIVDISAIMQVIGGIYLNPNLIDQDDKYRFCEEDFTEEFHKILFGSIYNLHQLGAKEISINAIEDYLEQRPKKYAVYKSNKGAEYLQRLSENIQLAAFDYYYNRMKKMTLLRMYQSVGVDVSWLYDIDNILDIKKKQAQEDWLDNTPIIKIADMIDDKINEIRLTYTGVVSDLHFEAAGNGLMDLLNSYKESPHYGVPLFGKYINTITEGAFLGEMYIESAPQNVGKTRRMIANACTIAYDTIYNIETNEWEPNNNAYPTLFITTEQTEDDIKRCCIAFLSGVEEGAIKHGEYTDDEWSRVLKAVDIMKKNNSLFIIHIPDFSINDIEKSIKIGIREHNVRYVFFDYIHTSMKILSEVSEKSGRISNLREDNVLFMLSAKLREIASTNQVFILTSTQLNGGYTTAETFDQNLLRGAKSIADKADYATIMLEVTSKDKEMLQSILAKGYAIPDVKISVYKNRHNGYKNILIWCIKRAGICRYMPIFITNNDYTLVENIEDIKIKVQDPQETNKIDISAF